MTSEQSYLLHLLACHLGGVTPEARQVDWDEVYKLADMHNVQAMISQEIKLLPEEYQPQGEIRSYFNQQIGLTLQNVQLKEMAKKALHKFLFENEIDHIFVKGCVINRYYPIPEYRTSGDIDVIVKESDFERIYALLKERGVKATRSSDVIVFFIHDVEIEVHANASIESSYFDDIFSLVQPVGERLFELDLYQHLLYVFCHMCQHLRGSGAGLRMLMDIDILIKAIDDFDEARFYQLCKDAGYEKTIKIIGALLNRWFSTPLSTSFSLEDNSELLLALERVFIEGGVFGFSQFNLGDHYLSKGLKGDSITLITRIKALILLFFPKPRTLMNAFPYAKKHKFLIPIAYFHKLYLGVFKRFSHSTQTIKSIMKNDSDISIVKSELNEELHLNL